MKKLTMTDALRAALRKSDMPHLTMEQQTGVPRRSIARFMAGEQSLRLDMADRLADLFGVTVSPAPKATDKRGGK